MKCNENQETEKLSKVDEINNYFKLPIYYNKDKAELNANIVTDFELISTIDQSGASIY